MPSSRTGAAGVPPAPVLSTSTGDSRYAVRGPRGAAVFVWDDGYTSSLTAARLHEARGQRVTFAITKNLIDTANHISADDVYDLWSAGHEIADHSVTHTNFLSGLTAAQRASELDENKTYLEGIVGAGQISTFVYPYGTTTARSSTTDREIYLRYERMLGVGDPSNVLMASRVESPPLVQRIFLETSSYYTRAQDMIRRAARTNTVAMFYVHRFTEDGGGISITDYTALADLCVSLGVPVLRADEAFPATRTLHDPGFEDSTLGAWFSVLSGAGASATSVVDAPDTGLSGTRSLRLVAGAGEFAYVTQPVQVQQGLTYTFSGRYRTSSGLGGSTFKVRTRQYDYGATDLSLPSTTNLAEATSWTRFSVDFTFSTSTAYVMLDLLLLPGTAGTAYADHVDFRPKHLGSFG